MEFTFSFRIISGVVQALRYLMPRISHCFLHTRSSRNLVLNNSLKIRHNGECILYSCRYTLMKHACIHSHICSFVIHLFIVHLHGSYLESKGNTFSFSVETTIRIWAFQSHITHASAHKPTELSRIKQKLELDSSYL